MENFKKPETKPTAAPILCNISGVVLIPDMFSPSAIHVPKKVNESSQPVKAPIITPMIMLMKRKNINEREIIVHALITAIKPFL
ncbi:MAG: hypothetical protein KKD69_01070 [Euryarchaeota archaeon]|nr:hypothetical protein [Euryarchaeota archaeon]